MGGRGGEGRKEGLRHPEDAQRVVSACVRREAGLTELLLKDAPRKFGSGNDCYRGRRENERRKKKEKRKIKRQGIDTQGDARLGHLPRLFMRRIAFQES